LACLDHPVFRLAGPSDARAVAALHADSWRRHYRGIYSDAFLDGDLSADRCAVWIARLQESDPRRYTLLAQDGETLVGFAHTVFDDDPTWGALLDNLHVISRRTRSGIGSRLLALTARAITQRRVTTGLYLWVNEQNTDAQAFYRARGAQWVGSRPSLPPGAVPGRLNGSPTALRYAWPDSSVLLA
jgi:ribosomal protein S18 acetylase RimI-like enzyme